MPTIRTAAGKGAKLTPTEADSDMKRTPVAKAADYTLDASHNREIHELGGTVATVSLPTPSNSLTETDDWRITLINTLSTNVTVARANAAHTIDGETADYVLNQKERITIVMNAGFTGFYTLSNNHAPRHNFLINGAMEVAQRGSSISSGVSTVTYTLDRWIAYATGAAVTISQAAGDSGRFRKALSIAGAASNTAMNLSQRLEQQDAYSLAGKSITFSARIYTDSAFTPTWSIRSADAADDFTTTTARHTGSFSALSTGWSDVSFNVETLDSNCANGFQVEIAFLATTAGVTKGITGAKLEEGSNATRFVHRPIAEEMALCKRYYQKFTDPPLRGVGNALNVVARAGMVLPVQMREAPTVTLSGTLSWIDGAATGTVTALTTTYPTVYDVAIDATAATGSITVGNAVVFYSNLGGTLKLDAEL